MVEAVSSTLLLSITRDDGIDKAWIWLTVRVVCAVVVVVSTDTKC